MLKQSPTEGHILPLVPFVPLAPGASSGRAIASTARLRRSHLHLLAAATSARVPSRDRADRKLVTGE